MKHLKSNVKQHQTKSVLYGDEVNPLSANPEKWSNTLKQIVGKLPTICLSVFDHFMNLALKGLIITIDKVSSNYALICKRFCNNCLLSEVGIFSSRNSNTKTLDPSKDNHHKSRQFRNGGNR